MMTSIFDADQALVLKLERDEQVGIGITPSATLPETSTIRFGLRSRSLQLFHI